MTVGLVLICRFILLFLHGMDSPWSKMMNPGGTVPIALSFGVDIDRIWIDCVTNQEKLLGLQFCCYI